MKTEKVIGILLAVGVPIIMIFSCTSSLFVVKGEKNSIKTEQNVKADSTSVSINKQ